MHVEPALGSLVMLMAMPDVCSLAIDNPVVIILIIYQSQIITLLLVTHLLAGAHTTAANSRARAVKIQSTAADDVGIRQDPQHQQIHTTLTAHAAQQNPRDASSRRTTAAVAAVWQAAHAAVQYKRRHSTDTRMQKAVRIRGGSAGSDSSVAQEAQSSDCAEDSSSLLSPSQVLVTS